MLSSTGVGPVCCEFCPNGCLDDGASCANSSPNGRDSGYLSDLDACNHDNPDVGSDMAAGALRQSTDCKASMSQTTFYSRLMR